MNLYLILTMKHTITIAVQKNKTTIYYKIPLDKLSNKQKDHYYSYNNITKSRNNQN